MGTDQSLPISTMEESIAWRYIALSVVLELYKTSEVKYGENAAVLVRDAKTVLDFLETGKSE